MVSQLVELFDESDDHEFEKFSQVILGDSRRKIIAYEIKTRSIWRVLLIKSKQEGLTENNFEKKDMQ